MRAEVVFFDEKKGYGFLRPDDGGKDIFVHFSAVVMDGFKTLQAGQPVEYEIGDRDGRPVAVNVVVIQEE
jgi:CspA family cold shock protein